MRPRQNFQAFPIFINARDLLVPLRRLVGWLLEAGYTRIYVLDNDSSYPPLLDYYRTMRNAFHLIPLGRNLGPTALWDAKILDRLGIDGPFVWTDPDIVPIEECPANVLEFFWEVLRAYPRKSKVGFGLRIDDLPEHYRFKQRVIAWESQFWEKRVTPKLYDADIDTTFALYRPQASHDPSAIRSGFPYLARHWPWYEDTDAPSDDQAYYLRHAAPGMNNWSGDDLPDWLDALIKQRLEASGLANK